MEKHPPAYLSPSRLSTYTYCPAEFHKRYVLKIEDRPTPERSFGTAIHHGIEASMRGQDDELAFLKSWRGLRLELDPAAQSFSSGLASRGLELLAMVRTLNLSGEPERHIVITHPSLSIPIIGYIDLWADGHIYDFKTAGYGWTQSRADDQIFQPAIYSAAYRDVHGTLPKFTFVVLPRIPGPMSLFDGTRTEAQVEAAFDRIKEIHELIEAKVFDCLCKKHKEVAA